MSSSRFPSSLLCLLLLPVVTGCEPCNSEGAFCQEFATTVEPSVDSLEEDVPAAVAIGESTRVVWRFDVIPGSFQDPCDWDFDGVQNSNDPTPGSDGYPTSLSYEGVAPRPGARTDGSMLYEVMAGSGVTVDEVSACIDASFAPGATSDWPGLQPESAPSWDECRVIDAVGRFHPPGTPGIYPYGQLSAMVTCTTEGTTEVELCLESAASQPCSALYSADNCEVVEGRGQCATATVVCGNPPPDGGQDAAMDGGQDASMDAAPESGADAALPTGGCARAGVSVSTALDSSGIARICQDETCSLLQTATCSGSPFFELYQDGSTYSVRGRTGYITGTSAGTVDATNTVVTGIPADTVVTMPLSGAGGAELVVRFTGGVVTVLSYER